MNTDEAVEMVREMLDAAGCHDAYCRKHEPVREALAALDFLRTEIDADRMHRDLLIQSVTNMEADNARLREALELGMGE